MIVPAQYVDAARYLTDNFNEASQNMFRTPVGKTGSSTVSHYISSGLIDIQFAQMLESPEALVGGAAQFGVEVELEDATNLLNNAIITSEQGIEALEARNLQIINVDSAE